MLSWGLAVIGSWLREAINYVHTLGPVVFWSRCEYLRSLFPVLHGQSSHRKCFCELLSREVVVKHILIAYNYMVVLKHIRFAILPIFTTSSGE